ncbi:MAG: PD40 domain-containing protein [Bryobacteraceae bacterium]|nr:PD40 domain-containing protein [Bryobacteraceae bacterium]
MAAPPVPTGWLRYADPATEGEVFRLTDPSIESWMPALPARAVTRRGNLLLFARRFESGWQAWVMDLTKGAARPLSVTSGMIPRSLSLSSDDRRALFFSNQGLEAANVQGTRSQTVYRCREGWGPASAITPSEDGTALWFVETDGRRWALQRLKAPKWTVETIVESATAILAPAPNPRRAQVLYRGENGELFTANFDGRSARAETPPGRVLEAGWSPGGNEIEYLFEPAETGRLVEIRERSLDERADKLIAKTSQFAGFARNANATVFVGASRSKASANVLLLLRKTRREFTLCEHKAQDPSRVNARFTPDSQKILFQTDRDGAPAIYMVNVERLVEKTET